MREIKFRAKDKYSNDWVYGSLVANISEPQIVDDSGYKTTIDVRTIGEYTGVTDKNGKEIYEGDVLRYWDFVSYGDEDPESFEQKEDEVEYDEGFFSVGDYPLYIMDKDYWPLSSVEELLYRCGGMTEEDFKNSYGITPKEACGVEVIGNIYDND